MNLNTNQLRSKWNINDDVSHSELCHLWHYGCAVDRLCNEVDRLRDELKKAQVSNSALFSLYKDSALDSLPE